MPSELKKFERLQLQHRVMFRCILDPRDGEKIRQLVGPVPLQCSVYDSQHKHGGHFVEKNTLTLMELNYYCPKMSKDIQGWIEQCKRCTPCKGCLSKNLSSNDMQQCHGSLRSIGTVLHPAERVLRRV